MKGQLAVLVLLAVATGGCPSSVNRQTSFAGRGECDQLVFHDGPLEDPAELGPICGGASTGRERLRRLDLAGGTDGGRCACEAPSSVTARVVEPLLQRLSLESRTPSELTPGCKDGACAPAPLDGGEGGGCFFLTDGIDCRPLAYVNGFMTESLSALAVQRGTALGGSRHDGDFDVEVCPFSMGLHTGSGPQDIVPPIDLRSTSDFHGTNGSYFKAEAQWCRWFGGDAVTLSTFPDGGGPSINLGSFLPSAGERVSMVGDWAIDNSWTELHEVRIMATARADPSPDAGDVWHLLTSGILVKDTAQDNMLVIDIPVPPSDNTNNNRLECGRLNVIGGCEAPMLEVDVKPFDAGTGLGTCRVTVTRLDGAANQSEHSCLAKERTCPCSNGCDDADAKLRPFCEAPPADFDRLKCKVLAATGVVPPPPDRCNPSAGTVIAFAGDIRAEWKDPMDVWQCDCACDDPSRAGASVRARVQGCTSNFLEPDIDTHIQQACNEACGGSFCGGAPHCRMGVCHSRPIAPGESELLGRRACEPKVPEVPDTRVGPLGDFEVVLDATSRLEVGNALPVGGIDVVASTQLSGTVFLNDNFKPTDRRLDFASLRLEAVDFTVTQRFLGLPVAQMRVTEGRAFLLDRFPAHLGPQEVLGRTLAANEYLVPLGKAQLAVRARLDGARGGTTFLNSGTLEGFFDSTAGLFTLHGVGADPDGHAARLTLAGHVVNRPPHANPGLNRAEECSSPTTTPVTLDGTASTDAEGLIEHYQWFAGTTGIGNQAVLTAPAALGLNNYRLHVYDGRFASHSAPLQVSVVDTRPPSLTLSSSVLCVWPPDHRFAVVRLGAEIRAAVSDVCDASPTVRIKSAKSSEPALAPGSGDSDPDVVSGDTTACLRAERQGPGLGRSYEIVVEATDASGNSTSRAVTILVPHDLRDYPECIRAEGVDNVDDTCRH